MEYIDFLKRICEVAQLSVLIPLIVGLVRLQHLTGIFKVVVVLFGISTLFGFLGYQLYSKGQNNLPLVHLHTLIEGLMWTSIYYILFLETKEQKLILVCLAISLCISFFFTTGTIELLHTMSNTNRLIESLLLLYCSGFSFNVLLQKDRNFEYDDLFLLNAGVFTYGLNNFTFALSRTWLSGSSAAPILEIWTLYGIFVMVYYILVAIAIWKHSKVPIPVG